MKLEDIHALRFDTLKQAEDTLAGHPHKYYYVCSNCGNKFTCRCKQKHEKVIIGSCPNCIQKQKAEGGIPQAMHNTLPTPGGNMDGNMTPTQSKIRKFEGKRVPPMY